MRNLNILMIAVILSTSAAVAFAGPKSFVVEPGSIPSQSFYVNVSVDHENRIYEEGELMTVTVETSQSGYLYLFYTDASGKVTLLFPNCYHRDNYVAAGKKIIVPGSSMNFKLRASAPFGEEYLQAIVSLRPLDLQSVTGYQGTTSLYTFSSREFSGMKNLVENHVRGMIVEGTAAENETEQNNGSVVTTAERDNLAEYTMGITTVPRGQVPQAQKRRFFIGICVAKYANSRIPSLPACENDIKEMVRYAKASPSINNANIITYVNEEATREKIRKLFFEVLPEITRPGDEIIIYWTGHGSHCSDTDGDDGDGLDETIIPYDADPSDPKTQIVDDEFGRWVQNLSSRKVLFIFDTCYSGGMATSAKSLNDNVSWNFGLSECATMKDIGQSNLAVIASSAKDQTSLVWAEKDMSVMTWFVLDALNKETGITHEQLYRRIKPQIYEFVLERWHAKQSVSFQDEFDKPMVLNP